MSTVRKHKPSYRSDGTLAVSSSANVSGPGLWVSYLRGKRNQATDELTALLEELVEELYPDAQEEHRRAKAAALALREGRDAETGTADVPQTARSSRADDFDDELRKELEELRAEREVKNGKGKRPPSLINPRAMDVDCLTFFSLLPPVDPIQLTLHFLRRVSQTGVSHLKYVQRLLPVTRSCPATMKDIEATIKEHLYPPVFGQGSPLRYKVLYHASQHDTLDRDALIKLLASSVPSDQGHVVDLSANAQWVISIRLYRSTASMALLPNAEWEELKKFNVPALMEVGMKKQAEDGEGRGGRVVVGAALQGAQLS